MKIGVSLLLIISVLLIALGSLSACSNSNASDIGPSTTEIAHTSPSSGFKVDSLAMNPAEVNAGVEALITAKVTNFGSTDSSYQGTIRIDNTTTPSLPTFLGPERVTIPAGATQLLSATTTINNPGTYVVTWDNVSQTLVVNPDERLDLSNPQNNAPPSAPDFTALDVVTGKTVSLKQYKGSMILLNFVNYGCDPSTNRRVGAQLLAIKQLLSQGIDIVPISVFCGCCPPEVLRQFARENGLNWPWILDSDYSIASKYTNYLKKYGYPTLIFIDKEQLINEVTGYINFSALNEKINKLEPNQVNN